MTTPALTAEDISVVVLAAGTGDRMGAAVPKQYIKLGDADDPDRTVLDLLLTSYESAPEVGRLYLVAAEDNIELARSIAARYPKVRRVVAGGETRHGSVCRGVEAVDTLVTIFHDAARPLLHAPALSACFHRFQQGARGVSTVSRPYASMLVCGDGEPVGGLIERDEIGFAMCPVGFFTADLREACAAASSQGIEYRDLPGMMLAHRPDIPIEVVMGHRSGFKLTYPEDIDVLAAHRRQRSSH